MIETKPSSIALSSRPTSDVDVSGRGCPVVMLHSSMGSRAQWRSAMARLQDRWMTIAVDLHGYGQAPEPRTRDFSLDDEVDRLEERVSALIGAGERLHLVGHSYGGAVAMRWARRHPGRIRSLGLYEPTCFHVLSSDAPGLAAVKEAAWRVTEAVEAGRLASGTRDFIDFWSGPGTFDSMPAHRQEALARRLAKVRLDFKALFDPRLALSDYTALKVPTLLIGGRTSPACAQRVLLTLAQRWPSARSTWINAGHMGPITDAPVVDELLWSWLDQVEDLELTPMPMPRTLPFQRRLPSNATRA